MRIAIALAVVAFGVRYWWHPTYAITIPVSEGSHRAIELNVIVFWVMLGLAVVMFAGNVRTLVANR